MIGFIFGVVIGGFAVWMLCSLGGDYQQEG